MPRGDDRPGGAGRTPIADADVVERQQYQPPVSGSSTRPSGLVESRRVAMPARHHQSRIEPLPVRSTNIWSGRGDRYPFRRRPVIPRSGRHRHPFPQAALIAASEFNCRSPGSDGRRAATDPTETEITDIEKPVTTARCHVTCCAASGSTK